MSDQLPQRLEQIIGRLSQGNRSTALALHALICAADDTGTVVFNDVATCYREDHLDVVRAEGRDAQLEGGRLSLDEVRQHLAVSVLPRLAAEGSSSCRRRPTSPCAHSSRGAVWARFAAACARRGVLANRRADRDHDGHHPVLAGGAGRIGARSAGLVKTYRRRESSTMLPAIATWEIVGLLGPTRRQDDDVLHDRRLIKPQEGRSCSTARITTAMFSGRAWLGYLSQEPSIFRKLTVERTSCDSGDHAAIRL